jgi:hypothetical protein
MPLLKGASSEYTTFIKYNAMTLPATAVRAASATALPRGSIIGTLTKASTIAARSSPRSSILRTYNTILAGAAAPGGGGGSEVVVTVSLPVSVGADAFIVKYSFSGAVQWATRISGAVTDIGNSITTDSTGVYVMGSYTSASGITLNNGVTLPITVFADTFIVKYNTSGVAQWATTISGSQNDQGLGITTDATGVYVSGNYMTTSEVTLNNGVTLPISVGGDDGFIIKYDTSGVAQWATTIPGSASSDQGASITTDATGVYVAGNYRSTSDVTLNNGVTLPISVNTDAFVIKYNTSGVAQWATTIRGTGIDPGSEITTDATGVYVAGQYTSTSEVTLNNGVTLPISVGADAFIIKYNTSGVAQWATTIRGSGSDQGYSITTDSTGVYVSGQYTSTSEVTLNNGKTLPISVGTDAFIVKYDTSGVAQWATRISGTAFDYGTSITTDATGVYVSGQYTSTSEVTLNNGKTLPISVGADAFIVKYDTSGVAQWATRISDTSTGVGNNITAGATGVYVTGYYTSTSEVLLTNGS